MKDELFGTSFSIHESEQYTNTTGYYESKIRSYQVSVSKTPNTFVVVHSIKPSKGPTSSG